jgi:2,3,4,5-tetrahydropyridine-2-carboxylate N-succinyltransferase
MQRRGDRYRDTRTGRTLDTWFPKSGAPQARSCLALKYGLIEADQVEVEIASFEKGPTTSEEAYLCLHLLSERQTPPNSINLEHIHDLLAIVAWTSAGPVLPEYVNDLRSAVAVDDHQLVVYSLDKFPRMVDYVIPTDVRIGDPDRVRLGAHLSPGTTVMHEGFVNFNAGTMGAAMVEGRVTPGVVVGEGSDVGAGSSIMGTLSGGGKQVNSVGNNSLLGANSGIGISLGDRCVVEAGLYLTAGTLVQLPSGERVKARKLSGCSDLLFRRNSVTGCVEVLNSAGVSWSGLNTKLHS